MQDNHSHEVTMQVQVASRHYSAALAALAICGLSAFEQRACRRERRTHAAAGGACDRLEKSRGRGRLGARHPWRLLEVRAREGGQARRPDGVPFLKLAGRRAGKVARAGGAVRIKPRRHAGDGQRSQGAGRPQTVAASDPPPHSSDGRGTERAGRPQAVAASVHWAPRK